MHAQELAYLNGLEQGKLNTKKAHDVMMATPRILDLVRHDDPQMMNALCPNYVYMSGADNLIRYMTLASFVAASQDTVPWPVDVYMDEMKRSVPNPYDLRDTYWHLLRKIDGEARDHNAWRVMDWLLDQYETPLYPHFTARESHRRYNAREQKWLSYVNSKDIKPLPRRSKSDVADNVYDIMRRAVQHDQRKLALKAAKALKTTFARVYDEEREHIKPYAMTFYRGRLNDIENAADPVAALHEKFDLLDEIDTVMGTQRTPYAYIKANLVKALASDNADIRDFFAQYAADLTREEKEDLLDDRMLLRLEGEDIAFRSEHIFFHRHPDVLGRFIDVLKSWDKGNRKKPYQRDFWRGVGWSLDCHPERRSGRRDKGYLSQFTIANSFDAPLKWDDVTRRLELFARATRYKLKPFSLDDPYYFECAMERALEFGHAGDLEKIIEIGQKQDVEKGRVKKDDAAPMREHSFMKRLSWAIYRDRTSRDQDTLKVLTNVLVKADDVSRLTERLVRLAEIPFREDRYRERGCSFYRNGHPMEKQDYCEGVPVVMDALRVFYGRADQEEKKEIVRELFGNFENESSGYGPDYTPMGETLRALQDHCDMDAVMAVTSFWYDIARPYYCEDVRKEILGKIAEAALTKWKSADDPQDVKRFMGFVKSQDVQDALICLNKSGHAMFALSVEDVFKPIALLKMFPDILPAEEEAVLDAPHVRMTFRRMDRIENNRDVWKQAGLTPPENNFLVYPPTNFDVSLYDSFLPVMKIYSAMERNKNAAMHAFKFSCLFTTVNKASKYLHNHGQGAEAVHDACLFELPEKGAWDKELWANLAVRWGNGALRWLPFAPQLEAAVTGLNEGKHPRDHLKLSECKPAEIRALVQEHCGFENKAANPALAETLLDNGVPESYFDETLDMLHAFDAQKDGLPPRQLPELKIDGADIGVPGYRLDTLPRGDYRNLWMGQYVNCCMHLANQGRNLAVAMFNDTAAAAYVIRKGDEIVGALHSWLSKEGNLVFNSWQPKTSDHDFLRSAFVEAAANKALDEAPHIGRVVMGQGRVEPAEVPYEYIEGNLIFCDMAEKGGEVNQDGDHYTADTKVGQFVIASRNPS